MQTIHIDEVYPKDEVYPFVVNFQNGYPMENFQSESSVFINENKSCKVVATEVDGTLYLGEETDEPLGKTLVLARNRKTGKVRLLEVGTIDLKPELKNDFDTSVLDNSALELGRKFGSKKNKQVLEQRERLKQNEQSVTAQMANVSQNLTQDQLDISYDNPSTSDNFYTPPINREATSVQEVFDLDTILTPEQYDMIIAETSDTDVMESLNNVIKGLTRSDLSPKLKVLALYASSLYNTVFLKAQDILRKSFVACSRSATLNKHILTNFFLHNANGKRMRPINYKDKALIHTIVFLLLINNFKFNIEEFSLQLKMSLKSMTVKLAMVGGYMVRSNNVSMAQLKLPLNKPPTRRSSKKF